MSMWFARTNRQLGRQRSSSQRAAFTVLLALVALGACDQPADVSAVSADGWYLRGQDHADSGELEAAIEDFERAGAAGFTGANYAIGTTYKEMGMCEAAIRHLTLALQEDPDDLPARFNLARVHEIAGDWSAAAAEYDQILDRRPEEAEVQTRRALLASGERPRWSTRCVDRPPGTGTPDNGGE